MDTTNELNNDGTRMKYILFTMNYHFLYNAKYQLVTSVYVPRLPPRSIGPTSRFQKYFRRFGYFRTLLMLLLLLDFCKSSDFDFFFFDPLFLEMSHIDVLQTCGWETFLKILFTSPMNTSV
jgi:hypothetical protein